MLHSQRTKENVVHQNKFIVAQLRSFFRTLYKKQKYRQQYYKTVLINRHNCNIFQHCSVNLQRKQYMINNISSSTFSM